MLLRCQSPCSPAQGPQRMDDRKAPSYISMLSRLRPPVLQIFPILNDPRAWAELLFLARGAIPGFLAPIVAHPGFRQPPTALSRPAKSSVHHLQNSPILLTLSVRSQALHPRACSTTTNTYPASRLWGAWIVKLTQATRDLSSGSQQSPIRSVSCLGCSIRVSMHGPFSITS